MISITANRQWKRFDKIYGNQSIIKKYYWFLFEFGKRTTNLFLKHLGEHIESVSGDSEYKKRLVVAEVRDKGRLAWFAVIAKSKYEGDNLNPNTTIFKVVPRFDNLKDDPVRVILSELGPWTAETIPFLPTGRTGAVVATEVGEKQTEEVRVSVTKNWPQVKTKLIAFGLDFENRMSVYKRLKVVRDLEVDALRYEFVLGKPVWRPSFRWIMKEGVRRMEKEKDLMRVWVDPSFSKYRAFRHFRIKLSAEEVKRLQDFQRKVRQG